MNNPLRDFLFGERHAASGLSDLITPQRTFDDVILPDSTRRALNRALTQIEKHDLLYEEWGLAERHRNGLGLAFNFAGPPGTGKTICAEAVANRLDRKLMMVRHADMQSMWVGQSSKNVVSVFNSAEQQEAVLFFDEADAIAGSRFSSFQQGYERESNAIVNVLLSELEQFSGVVIFATNLASSFDPAFERRIRTHILFEMPDATLREQIWKVQLHPRKTPLADDVDFTTLAERFEVSGGDIKNAVLKAAQAAIAEEGPDERKRIHQHHFVEAMEDVLEAKQVMQQSLFQNEASALAPWTEQLAAQLPQQLNEETRTRLEELETGLNEALQHVKHLSGRADELRKELREADRVRRALLSLCLLALGLATAALAVTFLV